MTYTGLRVVGAGSVQARNLAVVDLSTAIIAPGVKLADIIQSIVRVIHWG